MSIALMSRVWESAPFKGTDLLVLLCLADHANDDGRCWPSYARIAERSRTSPRWATACVGRLIEAGWLEREARGNVGKSNVYRVVVPTLPVVQGGCLGKQGGPRLNSTPGVPHSRGAGVNSSSTESSGEPSEKRQDEPSARPDGRAIDVPTLKVLMDYAIKKTDLTEDLLSKPMTDLAAKIVRDGGSRAWRTQVDRLLEKIESDRTAA